MKDKKIIYKNLEDGEFTPIPKEIWEYFNQKYKGQRVLLNADKANEIAEILRARGIDV